ncbi:MAG: hypothetical protein JST46_02155 [Bacteroidetes bacterium]|nr:hypothetical protein [Bacteroidota bacterium]
MNPIRPLRTRINPLVLILLVLASGVITSAMGPEQKGVREFGKLVISSGEDCQSSVVLRPNGVQKEGRTSSTLQSSGEIEYVFFYKEIFHSDYLSFHSIFRSNHSTAVFLVLRVIRR